MIFVVVVVENNTRNLARSVLLAFLILVILNGNLPIVTILMVTKCACE
jgi:hypothetical protein